MTADSFNAHIRKKNYKIKVRKKYMSLTVRLLVDTGLLIDVIANNLDRRTVE